MEMVEAIAVGVVVVMVVGSATAEAGAVLAGVFDTTEAGVVLAGACDTIEG